MLQLLGTFFIFSLTGALSPGPLSTVAIAEGSRRGRWSGWWLSIGHGLVEAVYVAVIALILWLGRDALLTQPVVMAAIALIGGLFLLWMGWQMAWGAWQNRLTLGGNAANQARVGLIPMGVFMSVSNPYWWIWWALIASLYVRQSLAWGIWGVFFLFIVHWLSDIGWLTCLAWLSGSGRNLISPRIYRWVLIGCGIILFFFGLFFVVTGSRIWATGNVDIL